MSQPAVLVLGTANRKKAGELVELLDFPGLVLKSLADFPNALTVAETADSFAGNARLKAVQQARHLGQWVLGEDSGIAVDALGGRPGIFSARYSDPGATDERNNQKLLVELGNTPPEKRTAHYVCHLTLADPQGNVRADCEARCRGRIGFAPLGSNGFGYDPLFEIVEYHRTFGQLSPAVKTVLSHRARAAAKMRPLLEDLLDGGAWRR
jgi:XTP/dITP diphosphohydrolase